MQISQLYIVYMLSEVYEVRRRKGDCNDGCIYSKYHFIHHCMTLLEGLYMCALHKLSK